MIPVEKLRAVRRLVTHADCPDGTASAMIVRDALPDVAVTFCRYSSREHLEMPAEPGMLFVDFSPPEARHAEFVEAGAVVLDHHKTARPVVEAFGGLGAFGDEEKDPGVCGAVLAFREVWGPIVGAQGSPDRVFRFARLAGVRDTWQRQDPSWREACAQAEVLRFFPAEEWIGHACPLDWDRLEERMLLGELLLKKRDERVRRAVATAYRATTEKGTRLVVVAGTDVVSDAAELIGEEADLVVGFVYQYVPGENIALLGVSLRSHTTFDCAAFARAHGGGGHTRAAGCAFGPTHCSPYGSILSRVEEHER